MWRDLSLSLGVNLQSALKSNKLLRPCETFSTLWVHWVWYTHGYMDNTFMIQVHLEELIFKRIITLPEGNHITGDGGQASQSPLSLHTESHLQIQFNSVFITVTEKRKVIWQSCGIPSFKAFEVNHASLSRSVLAEVNICITNGNVLDPEQTPVIWSVY